MQENNHGSHTIFVLGMLGLIGFAVLIYAAFFSRF